MKSLLRKRLLMLSVLLLTACGQMWASYGNGKPDYGTRCNGNSPAKTVIADGVMYSLYSNQNYIYTYEYHTCSTAWSSNYAVAVYAQQYDTRSELTIKSTIQDGNTTYTVVAIGEQFFWYNNTATKLTIPATVRTLETFALEDNTSNLREIVIEDSGDKLECYRTTDSYGAFSWNSGLKKVYIGRQLYTVGGSDYYSYAPFYKGDFTDLEVTFGPLVDYIYGYTFYNNSIKSIKAMPTLPPNWAAYAFGGVSSNIPVYVSYKTIDAYKAHSDWKYFTNYVLDTDLCKTDALNDLNAEAGENPSATVQGVVSDYKNKVNAATSGADVVKNLNAGKLAIQLQKAKDIAIAALNAEAGNAPSQTVANVRDTWIANVNKATTVDDVNTCKSNGIAAIQLQKAKDSAIAALNAEAGTSPSQTVANVRDTWIANVNNTTTVDDVNTCKSNGIAAIQLQKAKETAIAELTKAKEDNPSGAADGIFNDYKARIEDAASIDEVTAAKEKGIKKLQEYFAKLECEKASAKAELDAAKSQYPSEYADDIVNNCKTEIEAATTIEDVKNAKDEGIKNLQLEYNNLLNIKNAAIVELENAKEQYPSANASSIVAEGKNAINAATSKSAVDEKEKFYIDQLETAFEAELTNAKNDAINALNDAKKDYPSDEFEDIVSIYTYKINAATSTDAVTAIKNEGIQALAYAAEMPTVLHINFAEGSVPIEKEHFMTDSKITFDEDCNVVLTVNGNSVTYPWDMAGKITLFKGAPTVEFKANEDPKNEGDYYTTFYSSLEAYTIPEGVKAYTATVDEKQDGVILLHEIKDGVIPAETAVVLISECGSFSAYTSDYATSEIEYRGILNGTDVEIPVPDDDCYVLSGTSTFGIGLYPWAGEGKKLSANKAYLQLTSASPAKAFRFVFDEETTSIHNSQFIIHNSENDVMYNLNGVRVNDSYKGIVIKNGKKTLKK